MAEHDTGTIGYAPGSVTIGPQPTSIPTPGFMPHVAFGEAPPTPGTPEVDKTLRCCPFCGSGDIIGNSDKTVTCGFCSNRFQIILESPHPFMPSALDGVPGPEIVGPDGTSPLEGGNGIGAIPNDPNAPGADPMDPNAPPEVEGEGGIEGFRTDQPAQEGATLEQFRVARTKAYIALGGVLPEEAYMRHLAIHYADDRDAVLPQIRQEHGAK